MTEKDHCHAFSRSSQCYLLRSFPSIALRIPTAHIILRVISARALKMAAFSLRPDLVIEVNRHFLENEHGDQSFSSVVLN